jgi:PAS domain S-box-containing protein
MLNEIIVAGRKLELEDVHFMEDNAFVSLVFDTAGRIIFANSYFCQLSGFGSEEITGKVLFRATDEALCSSVLSAINIILLTGETWHGEIYQPKKNGEQLWLDARLTPRKDEHGEVFAFVMLGFDITRHMTIREKLHYRAHNDALTRTLNRQGYFIRSRKKSVPPERMAPILSWRFWIWIISKISMMTWGMLPAMRCCAVLLAG